MDEWIFYHGWGMDANFWKHWKDQFPQKNFKFFDRGYFKKPSPISHFTPGVSRKILVCHSYGLHLAPPLILQQANILILFGCFLSFHANQEFEKLEKLIQENPLKGLKRHLINQSYPSKPPLSFPIDCHHKLLLEDLKALKKAQFDLLSVNPEIEMHIFQGGKDIVVPPDHHLKIQQSFPKSHAYYFPDESHLLPYANPEVFEWIKQNFKFSEF